MHIASAAPQRLSHHQLRRSGFTVLELLVTMAISVVLMGLILPAIHQATEASRRLHCTSNLKQLGLSLHQFHDVHQQLPPGWSARRTEFTSWGWASYLLPELELSNAEVPNRADLSISDSRLSPLLELSADCFRCPSDSASLTFDLYESPEQQQAASHSVPEVLVRLPHANYVGIFGYTDPDAPGVREGEGVFMGEKGIRFRDITRGLSQVAAVGERTARRLPGTWLGVDLRGEDAVERVTAFASLGPNNPESDESELDSRHHGAINMLFADGHVRSVSDDVDRNVYRQMCCRSLIDPP
ncbi:MAG: DUF1559 domain-containing protein [Planctomyces sp.]|jgi:prepilin-type processing-associated H-X9-DG protein/prepilin-type N-terminal cleavage/methylation domain-containing protein